MQRNFIGTLRYHRDYHYAINEIIERCFGRGVRMIYNDDESVHRIVYFSRPINLVWFEKLTQEYRLQTPSEDVAEMYENEEVNA